MKARTLIVLIFIAIIVGCRGILAIGDREPCASICLSDTRLLECHGDAPPSSRECPIETPACVNAACTAIACSDSCKDLHTTYECAPDGSIRTEKACPPESPFCSGLGSCSDCAPADRCGDPHPSDGKPKGCYSGTAACIGPSSKIYAGRVSSCLVDDEGAVFCWGLNEAGEVGTATTDPVPVPKLVKKIPKMSSLALGYYHACGIAKDDRSVWCWGSNFTGQLGSGSRDDTQTPQAPTRVVGLPGPVAVLTAGSAHNCVIIADSREVYCWGYNDYAQCGPLGELDGGGGGRERIIARPILHPDVTNAYDVVTVKEHTCALRGTEPALVCWGDNQYGQLGPSTKLNAPSVSARAIPIEFDAGKPIGVAPSFEDVCAVYGENTGYVWCWGLNRRGQRGNGVKSGPEYVFDSNPTPVLIKGSEELDGGSVFTHVKAIYPTQGSHRCVKNQDESDDGPLYYCWGGNDRGELGFGELPTRGEEFLFAKRAKVIPNNTFSISFGDDHTCWIAGKTGGPYQVACVGETRYLGAIDGPVDEKGASEMPKDVLFPPRPVAAP